MRSDTQRHDQTQTRDNKIGADFQTERRLNWYGHGMSRDKEHILRKVFRIQDTRNFILRRFVYRNISSIELVSDYKWMDIYIPGTDEETCM